MALAERSPLIKPCAGLYPTLLNPATAAEMLAFIRAHRDRPVAIGEVGLGYWQVEDEADREVQRAMLAQQIALARALELPLNVHSRSAGRHPMPWLRELMHAFDGKAAAAQFGLEAGYSFSLPWSIVRAPQQQKLLQRVSLERLLLASDAPVLGPDKAQRNEPQHVWLSCLQVAAITGVPVEEIVPITTTHAQQRFPRAFVSALAPSGRYRWTVA